MYNVYIKYQRLFITIIVIRVYTASRGELCLLGAFFIIKTQEYTRFKNPQILSGGMNCRKNLKNIAYFVVKTIASLFNLYRYKNI